MTDRNEIARRAFRTGVGEAKNTHVNGYEQGPMVEGGGRRPWRAGVIVVSQNMVHADFAMALAGFAAAPGALIAIINQKMEPSTGTPAIAFNNAIEIARAMQLDWILFVGSDVVIPRDALRRLLRHDKDIVGATYLRAMEPHGLIVKTLNDAPVNQDSGIAEVEALPAGCLLVRVSALEQIRRPHFRPVIVEEDVAANVLPTIAPEYVGFCQAARAAGLSIFCDIDLSKEIVHVGEVGYRLQDTLAQPQPETSTEPANEPATAAQA